MLDIDAVSSRRRRPRWLVVAAALLLAASWGRGEDDSADPATPWGTSVNGLRIRLVAERASWPADEAPRFRVHVENVGESPLALVSFWEDWWHRVRLEAVDDSADWDGGAGLFIEYDRPQNATLAPGRGWILAAEPSDGERRFLRANPSRKPGDDWDYRARTPPGRYRATVEFVHRRPAGAPVSSDVWSGRVVSNVVEIVVEPETGPEATPSGAVEAPWGPAVGGLRLRLEAPRTTWRSGARPGFDLSLKNVGKKRISIPAPARGWSTTIVFESLDAARRYVAGAVVWPAGRRPLTAVLVPWTPWTFPHVPATRILPAEAFRGGPDEATSRFWRGPDELPAGRYRVFAVHEAKAGEPVAGEVPPWVGRVLSNELTVTVTD